IGEDIVLTWGLIRQGGRTIFEPTAIAFTDAPVRFGHFVRQRRRWARGMIEGLREHGLPLLRGRGLHVHAAGRPASGRARRRAIPPAERFRGRSQDERPRNVFAVLAP